MYLIASDAFQGKWSADIHNEWTHNLIADGKDETKVIRTKNLMDKVQASSHALTPKTVADLKELAEKARIFPEFL